MSELIAASGVLWLILAWVGVLGIGVFWPFMAFSVMRNIKRIRIALEQLAEMTEARGSTSRPGSLGL